MNRFVVSSQKVRGPLLTIDDPRELRHLRRVLRLGVGDRLQCCDERGMEYHGVIIEATDAAVSVQVERRTVPEPSRVSVWLAQSLLKGDRFEWVVQKATELGVARLIPLKTQHAVVRLTREQASTKLARWKRIAQESVKQCKQSRVPTIEPPHSLEQVLAMVPAEAVLLIPTLIGTPPPLKTVLERAASSVRTVGVLIGPEGDFSDEEVRLAQARGAQPVSLGPLTLRAETAAIATVAIVTYVFA